MKAGLCLAALLVSTAAFAQSSSPGPYIIDLRGAMSGAPSGVSFYPPVPVDTLAPKRAFGLAGGAHLYPFQLGVARLGFGVDFMRVRGSVTSVSDVAASTTVSTVAPQISFNFGTREGWSYLSGGYGTAQTHVQVDVPAQSAAPPATVGTPAATLTRGRRTASINIGGGARWFLREHVAVGFDVRFHRLQEPSTRIVGLSVGMSLR